MNFRASQIPMPVGFGKRTDGFVQQIIASGSSDLFILRGLIPLNVGQCRFSICLHLLCVRVLQVLGYIKSLLTFLSPLNSSTYPGSLRAFRKNSQPCSRYAPITFSEQALQHL